MNNQKGVLYRWTNDDGQAKTSIVWPDLQEENMDELRAYVERHKGDLQNHPVHISYIVDAPTDQKLLT